jgi:hypothetical protein
VTVDPVSGSPPPKKPSGIPVILFLALVGAAVSLSYLPTWFTPIWIAAFFVYFVWGFRKSIASVYGQRHASFATPYILLGLVLALGDALLFAFGGSAGALVGFSLWGLLVVFFLAACIFWNLKGRPSPGKR